MNDLSLSFAHEPFIIFSISCPVGEGSDREVLVGSRHPARVNPLELETAKESPSTRFFLLSTFSWELEGKALINLGFIQGWYV